MTPAAILHQEIERFKEWTNQNLPEERHGEWECDYPDWPRFYSACLDFAEAVPLNLWTREQMDGLLYAIARDNEMGYLADTLAERHPELIPPLTKAAIEWGEPDAKWQLAVELSHACASNPETESLLLQMARDADDYVRRRALMELARLRSPHIEELAIAAWHRPDENQQWTRIAVLWSLHHIQSSLLDKLLMEAEADERPYLLEYAAKIRRGEIRE